MAPFHDGASMLCHGTMGKSILVTGGARSGKSRLAEQMTLEWAAQHAAAPDGIRAIYIATAEALDGEMSDRIARHRARRGPEWQTLDAPLDVIGALQHTDEKGCPRLLDCLTLWLSNLLHADKDWREESEKLARLLPTLKAPVILVTNEVGGGIVPENRLARQFRDAAGLMNQTIAAACDSVYMSVAGYPIVVKSFEPSEMT